MKPYKTISPYTARLNEGNAFHMALCSLAVYKDGEDAILKVLKEYDEGYLSATFVDINSTQAALIEHEEFLCYAFRGTDEPRDWLTNLNAFPNEFEGGKYHGGFVNSFSDVWSALNAVYREKRREQRRPVFITGHSLGGALATICAAHFNYKDWPFMGLYTFGSPRCVEKHTGRNFNVESRDKTFRFQNSSDIVPRMPSRAMGYSHIGTNLFIDEGGTIQSDVGFWLKFIDYVTVKVSDVKNILLSGIKDHPVDEYFAGVKKWDIEL